MALFSRGPKFKDMQTEEERYLASGRRSQAFADAHNRQAAATQRHRRQQAREEQQAANRERAGRVKRVGTLRKIGRNTWETKGWSIRGVDDREQNVEHVDSLGGFSVHELCAMAHGSRCKCTR